MRKFGLIGKKLSHSFSPGYFKNKFTDLRLEGVEYLSYELENIGEIQSLFSNDIEGLNVTIPYKQEVLPFLDDIDSHAQSIGAVNCIRRKDGKYIGFNTDWIGFKDSLVNEIKNEDSLHALVLGYGGASKAIIYALKMMGIHYQIVSRKEGMLTYEQCTAELINDFKLIINTTSLGMYPNIDTFPLIDYNGITESHYLYDLVYNPVETSFLKQGKARGAQTQNGYEMLILQAEASWRIWNEP
jgi:shikimate dehydrogenase